MGVNCEPVAPVIELTSDETEALGDVYSESLTMQTSRSDSLGYNSELLTRLAGESAERTGRIFPAHDLNAKLTAIRKRGLLNKVGNLI